MPNLKYDLSYVGEVFGAIESVATAIELSDKTPEQQSLMQQLKLKLPVSTAKEWFRLVDEMGTTAAMLSHIH